MRTFEEEKPPGYPIDNRGATGRLLFFWVYNNKQRALASLNQE
jgi:hypothetical protein